MKFKYILPVFALAAASFISCDEDKMDWYKDPSHGEVNESELPLQLAEKILRYEALKNYADFKLGMGIDLAMYMEDEVYQGIVDENFDEVTIGYDMKHGAMVNSAGEINFRRVDDLVTRLQSVGLGLYGHTLVWHSNQNASYLNSLIAPTIIPAPPGSNLLDLSGLEDGSVSNGWNKNNAGSGIAVLEGKGLAATSKGVELKSSSSSANAWDLQLASPAIAAVKGHTYEISFYIRSEQPGKGRLSFSGLENNYPWIDWYGTGSGTEAFETTSEWRQVLFTVSDFAETTFSMNFDFGYLPDVTYYIDVENIWVRDLDGEPTVINLVANGTFDDNVEGWSKWNGADDAMSQATGAEAYQGGGALKVRNDADANEWDTQIHADFTSPWTAGKNYRVSFMVRSDAPGSIRCSTSGTAHYQGTQATGITWSEVVWDVASESGGEEGLNFDLGKVAGTYYIDNVVVQELDGTRSAPSKRAGATIIEKTPEEKAEIIGEAMESWVMQMVTRYKPIVKAWDVVNEPMDDGKPSSLKTGEGKELAADEFYWQDYLGKDYAVTAFKLARQYGNPDDKLFINDYNLEYNLAKCDGLIEYVKYIESKGAQVDGIGTQMHIGIDTNKENIAQMFQKLGATGKMIKVTELDIKVNTAAPTTDQLAEQAEMYRYVIDMYKQHVPEAQRHSITVWGVSDNPKEHEYWIPDDAPNIWDASYQRKHAYKGVADGLAGRDVSEDFTGELQP